MSALNRLRLLEKNREPEIFEIEVDDDEIRPRGALEPFVSHDEVDGFLARLGDVERRDQAPLSERSLEPLLVPFLLGDEKEMNPSSRRLRYLF